MNHHITKELLLRLDKAKASLSELSQPYLPLLEYYNGQSINALAKKLVPMLEGAIESWKYEEGIQAAGFEWYYDGSYSPEALGYGYKEVKQLPDLSNHIFGETGSAREDFDGNIEFGDMLFGASGNFDVSVACYPLYEFLEAIDDDDDCDVEGLMNLFTLRMFYCIHLAMNHVVKTNIFKSLSVKTPFFLFANNHDWSPILVFALMDDTNQEQIDLGENSSIEVPELNKWITNLIKKANFQRDKKTALSQHQYISPKEIENMLLELPKIKYREQTFILNTFELSSFYWAHIGKDENYKKISFKAFLHQLSVIMESSKEINIYHIHTPFVYMFISDPVLALETIRDIIIKEPSRKEVFQDCAKNAIRWAIENRENGHVKNETFALYHAKEAQSYMSEVLEL